MTFLRGPGAGHVGGWAAGPAELWHICVFIVRRGGGGGEGGRRLNSIYSSVVFREEREIEFTGDAAGRRAGEPGGLQGEVGEVGPGWAVPPRAALSGLGDPQSRPGEASPTLLPAVAQPVGPSRSGASRGDGRRGLGPVYMHTQPHLGEKKGGRPCRQVAPAALLALAPSEAAGHSFGWCHPVSGGVPGLGRTWQ